MHLDTDPPRIEVWRSARFGGDTKTPKSRRTLELPPAVVDALKLRAAAQGAERQAAGALWVDTGLVFTSTVGTELDGANVRREFTKVVKAAGIEGEWVPQELQHSFVSLLSEVEDISQIVGHSSTSVTETVYRHELRPVLTKGAAAISQAFAGAGQTSQALFRFFRSLRRSKCDHLREPKTLSDLVLRCVEVLAAYSHTQSCP